MMDYGLYFQQDMITIKGDIMNIQLNSGHIVQYQGPFEQNEVLNFTSQILYKIGISIGEDDYMSFPGIDRSKFESIPIVINGEQIQIGRTYMYEPGFPLSTEINGDTKTFLKLEFPKGCPKSTLIEVVPIKQEV